MANNSKPQVYQFKIRTSGMYLDRTGGYQGALKLEIGIKDNGVWVWHELQRGNVNPDGLPTIYNLDPTLPISDSYPVAAFAGIPERGKELNLALLVENIEDYVGSDKGLKYRVVAIPCPECWDLYKQTDPTRALDGYGAVVALGNIVEGAEYYGN